MSNRRSAEVARMPVVRIDHNALKHDFRVYHEDFQGMHARLFHVQLHGKPTLVVKHFRSVRLSLPYELDAGVLPGQWFQVGGLSQILRSIFLKLIMEALPCVKHLGRFLIQAYREAQSPLRINVLNGQDAKTQLNSSRIGQQDLILQTGCVCGSGTGGRDRRDTHASLRPAQIWQYNPRGILSWYILVI